MRSSLFPDDGDFTILVGDNSQWHKETKLKKFVKDTGYRLLTIVPYSPSLNPWEHFIGAVKNRLKRETSLGREQFKLHLVLGFWVCNWSKTESTKLLRMSGKGLLKQVWWRLLTE